MAKQRLMQYLLLLRIITLRFKVTTPTIQKLRKNKIWKFLNSQARMLRFYSGELPKSRWKVGLQEFWVSAQEYYLARMKKIWKILRRKVHNRKLKPVHLGYRKSQIITTINSRFSIIRSSYREPKQPSHLLIELGQSVSLCNSPKNRKAIHKPTKLLLTIPITN